MTKLLIKILTSSLLAVGLSGCGPAYDYRKASLSDTIIVPLGKSVQADNAGLSVMFDKVEKDSRCAINARCKWEGVGIVNVTVKQGEKSQKVSLSTINFEKLNNTENVFGKDIKLLELLPQKVAGAAKPELSQTTIKLLVD